MPNLRLPLMAVIPKVTEVRMPTTKTRRNTDYG